MNDKSHVTAEQHLCIVCSKPYDTEDTENGLCPKDEKLHKKGFIALVAIDQSKSAHQGDQYKPDEVWRTGEIAHFRRTTAAETFCGISEEELALPMLFVQPQIIAELAEFLKSSGISTH